MPVLCTLRLPAPWAWMPKICPTRPRIRECPLTWLFPGRKGGRLVRPPCTLHVFPVPIPAQLFHGLGLEQIFPEKPNGGGTRYLACSLQSDITVFFQQADKRLSKRLHFRIPAGIFHTPPEANLQIECTLPYFGPLQKKAGSATVAAGLFLLSCEAAFSG